MTAYNFRYPVSPLNGAPQRAVVAIVGTSEDPASAPLDDPTIDIWGMNRAHGLFRDRQGRFRADLWFDLHEMVAQEDVDLAWFAVCPVPLYLPAAEAAYPQTRRFPVEQVVAIGRDYFACSMSFMVALALTRGYQEIRIYGCDCLVGRELAVERANLSYWAGLAEGRGVRLRVYTPQPFGLLRHPARYGLDYWAEKLAVDAFMRARLDDFALHAGYEPPAPIVDSHEMVIDRSLGLEPSYPIRRDGL